MRSPGSVMSSCICDARWSRSVGVSPRTCSRLASPPSNEPPLRPLSEAKLGRVGPSASQTLPKSASIASARPASSISDEHTSELQSLMLLSYAFFFLEKKHHDYTT